MTDNNHPITPPLELVKQWIEQYGNSEDPCWQAYEQDIATQAARWGADLELEACCEEMKSIPSPLGIPFGEMASNALRNARRPKPKSLQDQALDDLERIAALLMEKKLPCDTGNIRRALESLTFGTGLGAPATERIKIDSSGNVGIGG